MSKLDVQFFKPFVDGTLHTIKVQCFIEAKTGKPHLKSKDDQSYWDIAGIIGITSSAFTGTIALAFPEKIFLIMMSKMLGETYTEITPDLKDGVAELLNIIFGHAKRVLNDGGDDLQKAIPSVVQGAGLQLSHLTNCPVFVLPFHTEHGDFFIEFCTEEANRNLA